MLTNIIPVDLHAAQAALSQDWKVEIAKTDDGLAYLSVVCAQGTRNHIVHKRNNGKYVAHWHEAQKDTAGSLEEALETIH